MNSYKHPTPEEIYENITNTLLNACEKREKHPKLPIKLFNTPQKLYQYRRFDKDGYNIENLKNNKIWCSSTKIFNDLHEGTVKMPSDEKIFKGFINRNPEYRKMHRNKWPRMPKINREKTIFNLKSELNKTIQNVFAVSCFTVNNSCHPMWAHYADTHEGFCVEFDFSETAQWLYPVAYSNKKIDYKDNNINETNCNPEKDCKECERAVFYECFITKSKDWSYEQEWRILKPNPKYGKATNYLELDFEGIEQDVSKNITGIYLGAKIEPANEAAITTIAKEKNIPIYKKAPSLDSFELQDKLIWKPN